MGQSLSSSVDAIVIERLGSENFSVGVSSMQGWRSNHEDSHSYDLKWRGDNIGHFAVFDGHGGEATAKYAAENLRNHQKTLTQPFKDSELRKNFLSLDEKLRKDLPQNTSGCTCVSAIITKESDNNYTLKVSNIGDSRVVLIRLEKEDLEATEDHKPENKIERERIEAAGGFVSDAQPPRVDGCLALSRAFGDFNYKQTSGIPANSQKVIAEPDIYTWKAKKGDIVVLACDGIFDVFTNEHLRDIIQSKFRAALKGKSGLSEVDVGEITSQIVTESLETGSQDNMTLMIICLEDGTKWNLPAELKPGNYNKEAAEPVLKCYQEFMTTAGFVLTHNKRSQNPLPLSCDECDRIFAEMKTCPCHTVNYCTQQCQKTHWKKHKDSCTHSNDSKKSKKGTTTTTTTETATETTTTVQTATTKKKGKVATSVVVEQTQVTQVSQTTQSEEAGEKKKKKKNKNKKKKTQTSQENEGSDENSESESKTSGNESSTQQSDETQKVEENSNTNNQTQTQTQTQTQKKNNKTKNQQNQPQAKSQVQPETKAEVQPEAKTQTKPEAKTQTKPEAKAQTKPEAKGQPQAKGQTQNKQQNKKK